MYFVSSLHPQQATSEHTCDVPVMAQDQKDTALNAWLLRPLYAMAHTVVGYITSNWKATDMTDERRPNAAFEVMGDDATYDMIDDKEEIVEQRQKYLASLVIRGMIYDYGRDCPVPHYCVPSRGSNWMTSIERTFRNQVAPLLPIAQTDVFLERVKRAYNYYFWTSTAAKRAREATRAARAPCLTAASVDRRPPSTASFVYNVPLTLHLYSSNLIYKILLCSLVQKLPYGRPQAFCQGERSNEDDYSCFPPAAAEAIRQAVADDNDTWVPLEKQEIEDDFFGADEDYDHVHEDEDYELVQEKEAKEWFPANIRRYEKDAYHEQIFPSCRRTSIRNRVYRWCRMVA
ncbi:hypothetical protein BCR43DRAFT_493267 [Syncephalastrum racemosum]|uniref:Uncharacterized protein n=1 Tax=Syncephalastrum racemosum TaxID=13706 RepID=A0A1X2HAD8_SYNRA|nr:hypothetical protein BCR43DRAFT_493267 [Syncephalastrum racemosum]